MKKIYLLLLLGLSTSMLFARQRPQIVSKVKVSKDYQAISAIIHQWQNGYNNGNAEKVAMLYTPDAWYLTQHFITGIVQGRAAIQAYVQRGVDARYHIDSIRILKLQHSGDFAYVIDRYDATNGDRKDFGLNLVVLRKIKGHWFIVAHEAAVPDMANAVKKLDIKE
ncbi:MAG: nuclear transport factor 2 family protein [Bacteroidales bacterium]|nr:nuclear transport factor 2 family protein [Bacteroidales bacterium]